MIGDKIFQRACETRLKEYVTKRFGRDDAVKNSENTPDAKSYYSIKKRYLLKDITDKVFHEYATTKWTDDYIQMYDFVDFIINKGNTNSTRGKYQEYIDYITAYYDVKIYDNAIDFINIKNKTLRELISPKREEYTAIWSINNMICNDPFLKNYKNKYLKPTYQQCVNKGDDRFYDLLFEKLDVIIEVQEYSFAHTQNFNDVLKEALVIARNKRIYYFKMGDYKENQYSYVSETLENVRQMLIQALLAKDESIRKKYVFHVFKSNMKSDIVQHCNDIKCLMKKSKSKETSMMIQGLLSRIEYLEMLEKKTDDNQIIDKIFDWKNKVETSTEKFIITFDDICKILRADTETKERQLNNEIYTEGNFRIKDDNVYLDWKGMVEVIINTALCDNMNKKILLNYLTNVEEIYEDIVKLVQKHYKACLAASEQMMDIVNDHIREKITDKYQKQLDSQENELNVLTEENAILIRKSNIIIKKAKQVYKSLRSKVSNRRETDLMREWKREMKELDGIYKKTYLKGLTFQKEFNQSIFEEIPDFPIVFTGFPGSSIRTALFDAICKEWNIPKSVVNRSYSHFCLHFTNIRPNNIPYIEIREDMKHRYCGKFIPDEMRIVREITYETIQELKQEAKDLGWIKDHGDEKDDDSSSQNDSDSDSDSSLGGEAENDDL